MDRHLVGSIVTFSIIGLCLGLFSSNPGQAQDSKDKVFVMYAASLITTFEETLGPEFQKEAGYVYDGEPRGSVQIGNMILDGLREPDFFVSAGTVPTNEQYYTICRLAGQVWVCRNSDRVFY